MKSRKASGEMIGACLSATGGGERGEGGAENLSTNATSLADLSTGLLFVSSSSRCSWLGNFFRLKSKNRPSSASRNAKEAPIATPAMTPLEVDFDLLLETTGIAVDDFSPWVVVAVELSVTVVADVKSWPEAVVTDTLVDSVEGELIDELIVVVLVGAGG